MNDPLLEKGEAETIVKNGDLNNWHITIPLSYYPALLTTGSSQEPVTR